MRTADPLHPSIPPPPSSPSGEKTCAGLCRIVRTKETSRPKGEVYRVVSPRLSWLFGNDPDEFHVVTVTLFYRAGLDLLLALMVA